MHCVLQGGLIMVRGKVILILVEGETDASSLGLVLSKLSQNYQVRFQVIRTDVTSDINSSVDNILKIVNSKILDFLGANSFLRKNDILKVVQITDTDGAFVSAEQIKQSSTGETYYDENTIWASDVSNLEKRNIQKSAILRKLIGTNSVSKTLPYEIYYFSCNLEHVLHNVQNATREEKEKYATDFAEHFSKNETEFLEFITNSEFSVNGNYSETWEYIKKDTNSLNRHTNFRLFFDGLNEHVKDS